MKTFKILNIAFSLIILLFTSVVLANETAHELYIKAVRYEKVNKDLAKAVFYYQKVLEFSEADKKELARTNYALGMIYLNGGVGVQKDTKKSVLYLTEATKFDIAYTKSKAAQYLGLIYYIGDQSVNVDYDKAKRYFMFAYGSGSRVPACYYLGQLYEKGQGGLQQSDHSARLYYEECAQEGDVDSKLSLALMQIKGGPEFINKEAVGIQSLEELANQGNQMAMNLLGLEYSKLSISDNGVVGFKDKQKAIGWFEMSANLGNSYAKDELQRLQDSTMK